MRESDLLSTGMITDWTKTSETRKFEFLIAKKNKKESIHYKKWENMLL